MTRFKLLEKMHSMRLAALLSLLLNAPILFVTLPWFDPTMNVLQQIIEELKIDGTPAYIEGLNNRLQREVSVLCLYFIGLIAVVGLVGIAANILTGKLAHRAIWFTVLLAASWLAIFKWPTTGSDVDPTYLAIFTVLPIVIGLLAAFAFAVSMKRASPPLKLEQNTRGK